MKVLICVDVQNDFCPEGSLGTENGNIIIPIINELTKSGKFDVIIATQDFHPKGHVSFASTYEVEPFSIIGGKTVWPDHCVSGEKGSELSPLLDTSNIDMIIRKGMDENIDSYSAFFDDAGENTKLDGYLGGFDITEVYIVGIATDFCVSATAMDCKIYYKNVHIIKDCCAAVNEKDNKLFYDNFKNHKIDIITSKDILKGN